MSFWPWRRITRRQQPLFQLGRIAVSVPARAALRESQTVLGDLLNRHQRGDWGQVDEVDAKQNELALRLPMRVRSCYPLASGLDPLAVELWVITSADRLRTTVLLPREIFDEDEG